GPLVTASVTGRPELDVGLSVKAPSQSVRSATAANVIVCAVRPGGHAATAKVRDTGVAAAKVPLPPCVACTVTLPVPVTVMMFPDTVAGPLVIASATVRPELLVGLTA